MNKCNVANTLAKVGLRLETDLEEEVVDATTYRSMVGSLRYLCNTQPDVSYSVCIVSRYMQNPRVSHMNVAKAFLGMCKEHTTIVFYFNEEREEWS